MLSASRKERDRCGEQGGDNPPPFTKGAGVVLQSRRIDAGDSCDVLCRGACEAVLGKELHGRGDDVRTGLMATRLAVLDMPVSRQRCQRRCPAHGPLPSWWKPRRRQAAPAQAARQGGGDVACGERSVVPDRLPAGADAVA